MAFMPAPQRSTPLGFALPLSPPSHSAQPIEQPTDIHRHVCAESHTSVPLRHAQGLLPCGCEWRGKGKQGGAWEGASGGGRERLRGGRRREEYGTGN